MWAYLLIIIGLVSLVIINLIGIRYKRVKIGLFIFTIILIFCLMISKVNNTYEIIFINGQENIILSKK